MPQPDDMVPIKDAELFVDALNSAAEIETGPQGRIESLLTSLRVLLGRDTRTAVWLLDDLERSPAPRIVDRYVVWPDWDPVPPRSLPQLQAILDEGAPLVAMLVSRILGSIRTPFTLVAHEAADPAWIREMLTRRLTGPVGYADAIVSMWAASPNRAVMLGNLRRETDPPYTEKDRAIMSLMLRAAAPMVDRELFRRPDTFDGRRLSPRQQEVLLMLLSGDSEKEIAGRLQRSVNTVHTFVRQLYEVFSVSSRGELMALFIDRAVFEIQKA